MYLILLYPDGRRFEAMLLSASPESLRLAIKGANDSLELRHVEGRWFSEQNKEIRFESWMAIEPGTETEGCLAASVESGRSAAASGYASMN